MDRRTKQQAPGWPGPGAMCSQPFARPLRCQRRLLWPLMELGRRHHHCHPHWMGLHQAQGQVFWSPVPAPRGCAGRGCGGAGRHTAGPCPWNWPGEGRGSTDYEASRGNRPLGLSSTWDQRPKLPQSGDHPSKGLPEPVAGPALGDSGILASYFGDEASLLSPWLMPSVQC